MTAEVSRWLASWPFPFTLDMARNRIRAMRELAERGNALPCAIVSKESEDIVGWITLIRDAADQRRGALGYWLGMAHHGNGIAREALSALLLAGFDRLKLDVIEAGAQPENFGSFAVMRACGMVMTSERPVYAPARDRDELCFFYEVQR
jgi:[ribosomal protein S5]-alanine N-acetyltransferase